MDARSRSESLVVDTLPLLSQRTGIARYTYEVSRHLLKAYAGIRFYYGYYSGKLIEPNEGRPMRALKASVVSHPLIKRSARNLLTAVSRVYAPRFDLYWEPNFIRLPQIRSRYSIVTVHDFSFRHFAEWHPRERREYMERNLPDSVASADRIITGSSFCREEIADFLGCSVDKIHVIPHGVDHELYQQYPRDVLEQSRLELGLPERFFLFVGSLEPRKNLLRLLRTYRTLPKELKGEVPLILAGFRGWNNREVMELIEGEGGRIRYLGYLEDRQLAHCYNLATVFLYPSLYEGFGLPPLEAMACGTAVIASRSSSLPEACGDAVYYVDPYSEESLREAMIKLLDDDTCRRELERKGIRHAARYDWEISARKHRDLFEEVLG